MPPGLPSPSLWEKDCVDENPRPPAAREARSSAAMAATSVGVASRSPSAPITYRRSWQWPTRNPAFTPRRPSTRSRYSGNVVQLPVTPALSAARGMPSTSAIISRVHPASSGRIGASVKPQLPEITVVMPWRFDGLA